MSEYTAISFAPVQGFIEKSRKLRDLYGSSGILSYLSHQLISKAVEKLGEESIISPGMINIQKGMPNRILLYGEFSRDEAKNTVLKAWQTILDFCRHWIEEQVPAKDKYHWEQEWIRWGLYTWEIFWGHGENSAAAMKDLETRKLRRDWVAINWMGESSSLTGTDAIAWSKLGLDDSNPGRRLTEAEKEELDDFYNRLSRVLENCPSDQEPEGKFLAPNERISVPELVKRLVTREDLAKKLNITELETGFTEIVRMPEKGGESGRWTGWFMGDGDKVGDKIKEISDKEGDAGIKTFSHAMRHWGESFGYNFPKDQGRVIYAGGDDFLGVLYTDQHSTPLQPLDAFSWLRQLPQEWAKHQQDITLSVGFVWAAPSVPQRDILQHCRDAEKQAKNLGRDRVTIRVVFNSGQYVQWTCPWDYLHVLQNYRDRDGKIWGEHPNWSHVYSDWGQLKARHAIELKEKSDDVDHQIALALFDLYFRDRSPRTDGLKPINQKYLTDSKHSKHIIKKLSDTDVISPAEFIEWLDGLINIGWQLCSNS
ncbi:MAG: CRISPR-associated protein Cmr2 [Symploca sp. SIO2E6]|nr:CRISPR-associated protein Cmr2 [Symploca sp. SIO2E6]